MLYGTSCTLPGSILDVPEFDGQELIDAFAKLKSGIPVRSWYDTTPAKPIPDLRWVYVKIDTVKPPLHPKYQGPYKVICQMCNTVRIKMGDDMELINISRIKSFRGTRPPEVAARPPQGHSPRAPAGGGM